MKLIKNKMAPMSQGEWKNWNLVSLHNRWLSYMQMKMYLEDSRKLQAHLSPSFQGCDRRGRCTDLLSESFIQGTAKKWLSHIVARSCSVVRFLG